MQPYKHYSAFKADHPAEGVLRLIIDTGRKNNGITHANHHEFGDVWRDIAREPDTRAVVVQGVQGIFCGGGDPTFLPPMFDDPQLRGKVHEDIRALVFNLLHCPIPVITALEGVCTGGGLAIGLMADVAIAAEDAQIVDGHVMAGLACGDHAAYWPLMMGMPMAKYHLLTARPISGLDARAAGLVALSVPAHALHTTALETAVHIAKMPADAVRLTKRSLNSWYQLGHGAFEMSAAYETMGFAGDGVREFAARALAKGGS
ncbi:MAG: enoyl-CoA hydratase-related protein [Pseudomonadota bacterium]